MTVVEKEALRDAHKREAKRRGGCGAGTSGSTLSLPDPKAVAFTRSLCNSDPALPLSPVKFCQAHNETDPHKREDLGKFVGDFVIRSSDVLDSKDLRGGGIQPDGCPEQPRNLCRSTFASADAARRQEDWHAIICNWTTLWTKATCNVVEKLIMVEAPRG